MNENHTDVLDPAESSFTCSNRPQGVTGHSGYLLLDQITLFLCQWVAGPQPWSHKDYRVLFWTKDQSHSLRSLCRWSQDENFLTQQCVYRGACYKLSWWFLLFSSQTDTKWSFILKNGLFQQEWRAFFMAQIPASLNSSEMARGRKKDTDTDR